MEIQLLDVKHQMTNKEMKTIFKLFEDACLSIKDLQDGLKDNKVGIDDWIITEFVKVLAANQELDVQWIKDVDDKDVRWVMEEHCRDLITDQQLLKIIEDRQ